MINLASRLGVAPAQGHTGFDRVVVGEETSVDTSYYAHYLHHKYFEVNYADGSRVIAKTGTNLLEIANLNDVPHANLCRGMAYAPSQRVPRDPSRHQSDDRPIRDGATAGTRWV